MEPTKTADTEPVAQENLTDLPPVSPLEVPVPDSIHLEEVVETVTPPQSQELISDVGAPRPAPPVVETAETTNTSSTEALSPEAAAPQTRDDIPPVQDAQPASQPKLSKPPRVKVKGSGVTAAITATVIIVLGLAILAVYAYIKTKK